MVQVSSDTSLPDEASWAPAQGPALPLQCIQADEGQVGLPIYLAVDHCLPVMPGIALIQGWMLDPGRRLLRLEAGSGQAGEPTAIFPSALLHGRLDVDQGMREHYLPLQHRLADGSSQGFIGLVFLADGERHVQLEARHVSGALQTWLLPVCSNEAAAEKLLAERANWLPTALAPLCHEPARVPEALLALLNRVSVPLLPEVRLEFDAALHIGSGVFLSGWGIGADDVRLDGMFILTGDPQRPVLYPDIVRIARPDVVQHLRTHRNVRDADLGFLCWIPSLSGLDVQQPWTLACADGRGGLSMRPLPLRNGAELESTATTLLHSVPLHNPAFRAIYDAHTGPALEAFYAPRRERQRPPVRTMNFGTPVAQPKVSIIVPLYGRWDFMEYQLAQFRHDPSLRDHELIYFVDDPAIYDGIVQYWRNTWPLYEFPFTLAFTGENHGFAGANNAAVSVARGRHVLLLNSDVIPTAPGWMQPMLTALATQPKAGVVGPTLLYGDGAVQHAGMTFERYPHWGDLWTNLHPGKGWPAQWVAGDRPREVPALTGACMLMDRALYDRLGGLDEGYIRGDFEDSDLCLKIREDGLLPYLVPQVTLYHLERQSQDINARLDTRTLLTIYNCWRHTHRWDAALDRVSREVTL